MKLALRIISYALGSIMLLGMLLVASDNELDAETLFVGILIITQSVLAIIYTYKK